MVRQIDMFGRADPTPKRRGIRALPLPGCASPKSTRWRSEAHRQSGDQPIEEMRARAKQAATVIRTAIMNPTWAGEPSVAHIDMSRPRRGVWLKTWRNLPGLVLDLGARTFTHELLPGWQYTPPEMKTEMVEDLEHFAETGEQPKVGM
jgi:hypothetical protein